MPPKAPKATRVNPTILKVSWTKIKEVDGYIIYRYNSDSKTYKRVATASKSKSFWIDKNKQTNKTYSYKIRSYIKVGNKKVCSSYTYPVSAKTHKPNAKKTNVAKITAPSKIVIGLREKRTIEAIPYASSHTSYDDPLPISNKLYYSASNKNISVSKKGVAVGKKIGTSTVSVRAHNGQIKKVQVTVKNFAYPKKFNYSGVPQELAKIIEDQKSDLTYIANYFLTHPNSGTGYIALGSDDSLRNPDNIVLGEAEAAITRVLNEAPLWITLVIDKEGIGFQFRDYEDRYYPYWELEFWYFGDLEDANPNYDLRIAPRWICSYAGVPV
jgi:hypothetical protein